MRGDIITNLYSATFPSVETESKSNILFFILFIFSYLIKHRCCDFTCLDKLNRSLELNLCYLGNMSSDLKKRFIRWMEDNRGLILTVIGLPASFLFDIIMRVSQSYPFSF